jgi:hypothetical protein
MKKIATYLAIASASFVIGAYASWRVYVWGTDSVISLLHAETAATDLITFRKFQSLINDGELEKAKEFASYFEESNRQHFLELEIIVNDGPNRQAKKDIAKRRAELIENGVEL